MNPVLRKKLTGSQVFNPNFPLAFTGLAGWYKADSLSLPDGTAVGNGSTTDWLDSSGNGHTMTQGTPANRPTYVQNVFGSRPGIRFVGGSSVILTTSSAFTFSGDFTWFITWRATSSTNAIMFGSSSANRQVRVGRSGVDVLSSYNGSVETISGTAGGANIGSTARCAVWRRTGSTIENMYNNTQLVSGAGSSGSYVLDAFGCPISGVACLNGWFAEVLFYSTYYNNTVCASIYNTYLKPKWGLP